MSIDKVVVDYKISSTGCEKLARLIDELSLRYVVDVRQWSSVCIGTFRENITVKFQDGNSFWLGVGLNSTRPLFGRIRIEFNPNKCVWHSAFLKLLAWLNVHSRPMHTSVKRFDLAVDIPVSREDVRLVKDRRTYSEIRKSTADWTEYLGAKSSTVGRVKLYNKTLEAGLSYPLTRLELTLDPDTPFDEIYWPVVYMVDSRQMGVNELRLTDTERFVLGALLDGYGRLTDLGRKTREKMQRILSDYVQWVVVSEDDYKQILDNLRSLLRYPTIELDADFVSPDRLPPTAPLWVAEAEKAPVVQKLASAVSSTE